MKSVIILGGGSGSRTGLKENKIKMMINDKPMIMHSVDKFSQLGYKIVLVANKEDYLYLQTLNPNIKITLGGMTRSDSVRNGLKEVNTKYVLIHDGARPFIDKTVIKKVEASLKKYDAVLVCKPVINTIYTKSLNVLDRNELLEAETPQAFLTSKIKEAYQSNPTLSLSDDISMYKLCFKDEIGLVYHDTNNDKITTKEDIMSFKRPSSKIGFAYDIHQTDVNRPLILGGIKIDSPFGLKGHSDADVLIHAVAESLLGALGLGDLGHHFPDTDMNNKDLDSKKILAYTAEKLKKRGYRIENIDASIYCEKPKLASYIPKMREVLASILKIDVSQINIKAGTNEAQDAIGKSLAIAASSSCVIWRYV